MAIPVDGSEARGQAVPTPVLRALSLSKSYGPVEACRAVSLDVYGGQLTAIVGDNGAGKSTVARMITGAIQPDSGGLEVAGKTVDFADPIAARGAGVEAVYQELALAPNLDVVHNLFLGREIVKPTLGIRWLPRLAERTMLNIATEQMAQLQVSIPHLRGVAVGRMSGGQRQTVAIARAILWASKVLVMDEPTAALGVKESKAVLDLVQRALAQEIAVVMISHIMSHVMELADHVVVMRHGEKVADMRRGEFDTDRLVREIVGA